MNVSEIAQATGFSQPMVSRQLGTLRNAGIVQNKRQGTEINYQLADKNIVEVCDLVRKVLTAHAQKQSESLRS